MLTRCLFSLAFAALFVTGCNRGTASTPRQTQPAVAPDELGSRLPDFSVNDLQGRPISSGDLRGKVVLVDFWATWCQPCKKEMPSYQQLLDRYRSQGFAVIGIKFDTMQDAEDPLQFAKRIGVRYPLVVATDDLKQKFGGIEGLPTTLLYDRKGVLRKKVVGFEYANVFEDEVKLLL